MASTPDQITDVITALADQGHTPGLSTWPQQERIVPGWLPLLMQRRMMDYENWRVDRFNGSVVTGIFATGGVNTEVITATTVGEGGIMMTTATADNDSAWLHPHATLNSLGIAGHWSTLLEPFCIARVLCGPIDTQQNTEVEYSVGLAVEEPSTDGPSAAPAGTAEGARWQVTNGAAAGTPTNWKTEISIGDTDTIVDIGVLSQRATYVTLGVFLDADRKAHFFSDLLGGRANYLTKAGATSAALASGILTPHIMVQVNNTTADDAKAVAVAWAYWGQRTVAR